MQSTYESQRQHSRLEHTMPHRLLLPHLSEHQPVEHGGLISVSTTRIHSSLVQVQMLICGPNRTLPEAVTSFAVGYHALAKPAKCLILLGKLSARSTVSWLSHILARSICDHVTRCSRSPARQTVHVHRFRRVIAQRRWLRLVQCAPNASSCETAHCVMLEFTDDMLTLSSTRAVTLKAARYNRSMML